MKSAAPLLKTIEIAGFKPTHVTEVGIGSVELCDVTSFILNGTRTTLVDANPSCIQELQRKYGKFPNVNIIHRAVADKQGWLLFVVAGSSSYVLGVESPKVANEGFKPEDKDIIKVPCCTFDAIDDGTIDVLAIDIEGCEWAVIKNLISRPKVITFESKCTPLDPNVKNPFVNHDMWKIKEWLATNKYKLVLTHRDDEFYIREE